MEVLPVKNIDIYDYLDDYKKSNKESIEEFLMDLTLQKPFGDKKFYVHSFFKDNHDGTFRRTLFHHPRLTKPKPSDNTMLFRIDPKRPGDVEVMWIIPGIEAINLFKKGKVFEDELIHYSIEKYLKKPEELMKPEPDDLTDQEVKEAYKGMDTSKGMPCLRF